jgi:hypothetical protein
LGIDKGSGMNIQNEVGKGGREITGQKRLRQGRSSTPGAGLGRNR